MSWTPGPWARAGAGTIRSHDGTVAYLKKVSPADYALISLAPEMAELLETICSNLDSWHLAGKSMLRPEEDFVYKTARDLLARARGEA